MSIANTIGQIIVAVIVIGGGFYLSKMWIRMMEIHQVLKELDREIASDNLACAQEERRAAAPRMIAANEIEADRA